MTPQEKTNHLDPVTEATTAWYIEGSLVENGPRQRISIPSGRFQVGRLPGTSVCLSHSSVSKQHAEFVSSEQALFVRDLGSTNGTFVNGERITKDTPIGERDVIQFANFDFTVGRAHEERCTRTMVTAPSEWQSTLKQFQRLMSERSVIPNFQPIVRLSDESRIGYELLARSGLPGMTNPKQMFGAAERIGLAARLSVLCRENGVEIARRFEKPGLLFVNSHPSESPQAGLLESLTQLRSIAPNLGIVLELHEAAVTSPAEIGQFRDELRQLGIQLAYDDFGSGQARLMELAEVAPDFLKFDIGLIAGIHLSPRRQQMVEGLVQLVLDLGIQPLAEGIEHSEEAEVCRQIGFTHAQGYFFGKPAPGELPS